MKRILLVVFIITLIGNAYSQDNTEKNKIQIGLKVSPGVAWMKPKSSEITSNGSKFGFSYGLIAEYFFYDYYGISSGINVIYDGGKLQYNEPLPIKSVKYKLQHIELPVTIKMRTKEYGYLSYNAQFGIGFSTTLNAKSDYEYIGDISAYPNLDRKGDDINVKQEDIHLFRTSFIIGAGVEYTLTGNTRALLGVTFDNGLTNIIKIKNRKGIDNYLGLNLGVLF